MDAERDSATRLAAPCPVPLFRKQDGPKIDDNMVAALVGFGLTRNAARRACVAVGNAGLDTAFEWYVEHIDDHDIQSPLSREVAHKTGLDAHDVIYASSPECVVCLSA